MLARVHYVIHLGYANGQAKFVEFQPKPATKDGDLLHLTLEDGRVLNCSILGDSHYCAVVGDGPIIERRSQVRNDVTPQQRTYL